VKAVVLFSGGAASWAAAKRSVTTYGLENVTLLFTDTMTEDEDLYRFLDEAAEDVGAPLVRLADGRDIWQVFRDVRFLGNSRIDPCSAKLKRAMSRKWIKDNCDPSDSVIVMGFDWTELHRLERAQKAWAPYVVVAPMTEKPYRLRAEILADLEASGIRQPRLYTMGFEHNNCGGGCVKAGIGHFAHLRQVFPERYAEWEANEEGIRQFLGADVSILRDRINGNAPMTLRTLREKLSLMDTTLDLWDMGGCACFEEPEGAPSDGAAE
jgi:hypothetical protein